VCLGISSWSCAECRHRPMQLVRVSAAQIRTDPVGRGRLIVTCRVWAVNVVPGRWCFSEQKQDRFVLLWYVHRFGNVLIMAFIGSVSHNAYCQSAPAGGRTSHTRGCHACYIMLLSNARQRQLCSQVTCFQCGSCVKHCWPPNHSGDFAYQLGEVQGVHYCAGLRATMK
jgi:hypothetical protein